MEEGLIAADLLGRLANGSQAECIEAAKELARREDRAVLPEVVNILCRGESEPARKMAAWLLGELSPGTELTIGALHGTISDPDASESLRGQAIESLGNQVAHLSGGDIYERAADAIIPLLQHSSVEILFNAVFAVGTMRCRRARTALVRIAAEDHRTYKGVETISQCAQFSIQCIDCEPSGGAQGEVRVSDDAIRELIPRTKSDLDRAEQVVARGYPAVAPILPQLLEWLQDYNWPVAQVLAPFLASIGSPLVPEIRRVLKTEDHVWKYWLLTCLVKTSDVAAALFEELTRLAVQPTPAESAEELNIIAREILDQHALSKSD